jgi:predicted ATPase
VVLIIYWCQAGIIAFGRPNRVSSKRKGKRQMITELQVKSFKSWEDTGPLRFAPLTGFFGTNSSGKTSILQLFLMLKQTVESLDRKRVLHTGDDFSIVDLGTFPDLIHCRRADVALQVSISWDLLKTLKIKDPQQKDKNLFEGKELRFDVQIEGRTGVPTVRGFSYSFADNMFGMRVHSTDGKKPKAGYDLVAAPYHAIRQPGRPWPLPSPMKFYGFPDQASAFFQNVGFLSEIVLEMEGLFGRIKYLGSLRDNPKRIYTWAGEAPSDVGRKGELAVPAILAAREKGPYISPGHKKRRRGLEETIAKWLRDMGIIDSFSVKQIGKDRKDWEVLVQKTTQSPEVLITDVGFGLSQVLPVLVLCYYVPEGSVLLLEQPELHLHPSAQSWLADIFIDVVENRNVQVIVESHSEHFVRRLQLRIAEKKIPPERTALYFLEMKNSASRAEKLDVDLCGDIRNWPKDFFGDEMGETVARARAAMERQAQGD